MTLFAVTSVAGAPGVTTLACAMGAVWPAGRDVVVAECDPAGGDLAPRFGLSAEYGLTTLVLKLRHADSGDRSLSPHVQHLPGGLEVLCGPVGGDAALVLDGALGEVSLSSLECDVVADCGRIGVHSTGQLRVLQEAARVVVLLRPDASSVAHGHWAVQRLRALRHGRSPAFDLVLVGRGAFRPMDIAETLGVELLGVVPRDPVAAAMLRGEPGRNRVLARSALVASAKKLVAGLRAGVPEMEVA